LRVGFNWVFYSARFNLSAAKGKISLNEIPLTVPLLLPSVGSADREGAIGEAHFSNA